MGIDILEIDWKGSLDPLLSYFGLIGGDMRELLDLEISMIAESIFFILTVFAFGWVLAYARRFRRELNSIAAFVAPGVKSLSQRILQRLETSPADLPLRVEYPRVACLPIMTARGPQSTLESFST